MYLDLAIETLSSPIVLFFVLGLTAALLRSSTRVPESAAKALAIYLMMAIGMKGGVEMSKAALTTDVAIVAGLALLLSFGLPFLAYVLLRGVSKLSLLDAAATAGHYGSISIVTFVAATQAMPLAGIESSGYMVAMAAIMEVPAIISALLLARRDTTTQQEVAGAESGELFREVFLNASVVVLLGSLVIGWVGGTDGMEQVSPFLVAPFKGALCLFLLDMGLNAGRGLRQGWRQLDAGALAFGVVMPLLSAVITVGLCRTLGCSEGDTALLTTLAASASYIAVPAAMRLALPEAQPSIYLTLSLGVTFPFNLTIGIPTYLALAKWAVG